MLCSLTNITSITFVENIKIELKLKKKPQKWYWNNNDSENGFYCF